MLGLKLIHVSKRGPWYHRVSCSHCVVFSLEYYCVFESAICFSYILWPVWESVMGFIRYSVGDSIMRFRYSPYVMMTSSNGNIFTSYFFIIFFALLGTVWCVFVVVFSVLGTVWRIPAVAFCVGDSVLYSCCLTSRGRDSVMYPLWGIYCVGESIIYSLLFCGLFVRVWCVLFLTLLETA